METLVHHIALGLDDCWIIQGDRAVMVDGGSPWQEKAFDRALTGLQLPPQSIQLLIITHGHWDHIATASHIKLEDIREAPHCSGCLGLPDRQQLDVASCANRL